MSATQRNLDKLGQTFYEYAKLRGKRIGYQWELFQLFASSGIQLPDWTRRNYLWKMNENGWIRFIGTNQGEIHFITDKLVKEFQEREAKNVGDWL